MNDMYVYDSAFQNMAASGSAYAASQIIAIVRSVLPVQSVLDVGCARGTWLRQWQALGTDDVVGVDGDYVDRDRLEIAPRRFVAHDLARRFDLERRFDLVQSLEVAEHLPEPRSESFVADLVAHAPAVLFSAAPPGQGGEHHINEQPLEYWHRLFRAHDYVAIDCLRPLLDRNSDVPSWYRYNLMLYVQRSELWKVAPYARMFRIPDEGPVPDTSPLGYRLRKHIVRLLPRALCDRLARWNARRYPDAEGTADIFKGSPERFGYSWDRYADLLP